jgi:hypothetical protein
VNFLLTITEGPDAGRTIALRAGESVLIGRGRDCALKLSDPAVSREHCRVIVEADSVRLEDAGSKHGMRVNGRRVTVHELRPGDVIEIGDTSLRFEVDVAEVPTAPPLTSLESSDEFEQTQDADTLQSIDPIDINHLAGRTFLRFRAEAVVARSASGILYRAIDTQDGEPVALKIFWPALFDDSTSMARFLRSMRAMVPLEHEHLVKLYAAGRSRGICFAASEFIAGESAAQLIQRVGVARMLDWRTTFRIALGIAQALEYLHEQNILHRSIRPNNILVRQRDHCVKLGDSVLAKALDQLGESALTRRGEVVGDVYYLAPEQVSGETVIDQRADIYSLGATVYALLTGRPPFLGGPSDVVGQILAQRPEPPTKTHLAIPAIFEGVVLRMLAKRPEDRFSCAAHLLKELRRVERYQDVN